ncbi:thioredoxin reductase 1, cytoplasmic-like isoform X2 [Tubulanus polymorphus]|uniref:thioredoxin reductase 1, cytoplasmic-like isoform X2 n=1 Tax=Tubulanus polymorphus TaxID=672921 RepID=UPI003DA3068B
MYTRYKHFISGGCDATLKLNEENKLLPLIAGDAEAYDYDLVVIGGGSGGLAAAKEAANLGLKVALLDFVTPTPQGTTWNLGGTCVNVGCIPKKLMHQAALLRHSMDDARKYGWNFDEKIEHDWDTMKDAIQAHIGSISFSFRVELRTKSVTYLNAYGEFVDQHKLKTTNKRGKVTEITSEKFILATGMRPRYLDIPGAKEYAITSDDLFSLPYAPGKTLCIGASYVSLECAGFLTSLGMDVTVMVRSILLRGFDQQMAELVGDYMQNHGTKFIRGAVPTKIERIEEGTPGKLRVYAKTTDGQEIVDDFNTVLFAIGRDPCTKEIGLDKVGLNLNKNGFVSLQNEKEPEATNIPHIYACGDLLEDKLELTPLAVQAGKLLARRLAGSNDVQCDYVNVPTTVFTPLEYGCIGYSEEAAIQKFGEDNIEVFHSTFRPLEWSVADREKSACYAKLVCHIPDKNRVIGFHIVGINAGEITQGYAVAMRVGATKEDFDATIGIHPTCSEKFTTLDITKRSGLDTEEAGCGG